MTQSKATVTTKSEKRKSSSARKSSTVRNSSNARKQSPARKAAAPRASARRARSGQPGRNGVGPRRKRTISAVEFIAYAARTMSESSSIKAIYDGRVDKGFREQLMVAVAYQNQAPYCNWTHRSWASVHGVPDEELGKIEELHLEELDPKVATAVAYVRALVSSDWQDAPRDLREQMQEHFTWREIEDVELIARAMDISNRVGNTWDAMLSRLSGEPIEDSDLLSEIFLSSVFLPMLPVGLSIVSRLTGVSVPQAAQGLVSHVQHFKRQAMPTGAGR